MSVNPAAPAWPNELKAIKPCAIVLVSRLVALRIVDLPGAAVSTGLKASYGKRVGDESGVMGPKEPTFLSASRNFSFSFLALSFIPASAFERTMMKPSPRRTFFSSSGSFCRSISRLLISSAPGGGSPIMYHSTVRGELSLFVLGNNFARIPHAGRFAASGVFFQHSRGQ